MVWMSKGSGYSFSYDPDHFKFGQKFLSGFQMDFDKIAPICPDFKSHWKIWTICKPTSLTIPNPDLSRFQIRTVQLSGLKAVQIKISLCLVPTLRNNYPTHTKSVSKFYPKSYPQIRDVKNIFQKFCSIF